MPVKRLALALLIVLVALGLHTSVTSAQPPTLGNAEGLVTRTVDFSTHVQGVFEPDFYKKQGIVFTEGWFVGYIQGRNALGGPMAGTFTPPVSQLFVQIAPSMQGTAEYTLKAFNASRELIASMSIVDTQDFCEPEISQYGYFAIGFGELPERAKYFTLENRFIRACDPRNEFIGIGFGISTISYSAPGR